MPPVVDTIGPIQKACQCFIQQANLLSIPPASIIVRMMPTATETLQVLPCVIISPFENIDVEVAGFDSMDFVDYFVEISLVAAANLDFATKQSLYQGWHKAARLAITRMPDGNSRSTLDSVPSVWNITSVRNPTFNHSKLNQLYAYQSVVIKFSCYE